MNKIIKIVGSVFLIGLIGYWVYAWLSDSVQLYETKEIHVGVILPLTGQYASIGETDRNAMLLAKEELKADNIKLYFEDDAYDAKTAVTSYQKLRSLNHIDVVVVLSAPSIQSIAPLTNTDNIPLLGLGGTIVYQKDTVFQLMPSGNLIFPTLGKMYGEKYKKIAVAHSNAALFAENTRMFRTGLPSDVTTSDFVINPSTDHRTEVQKVVNFHPEAVTLFMPKEDAVRFLQALRVLDRSKSIKIVCDFGVEIAVDEYTSAIGKDRLEGCVSTNLADTTQNDFKNKYKSIYGSDTQITADYAYDSIQIIKELAEKTPKARWVEELSSEDFVFHGDASGEIKFNEDGTRLDLLPTIRVYNGGKFVPLN
jgi:ABC-type branched-subunit amino acid transport system substrate-binding protein